MDPGNVIPTTESTGDASAKGYHYEQCVVPTPLPTHEAMPGAPSTVLSSGQSSLQLAFSTFVGQSCNTDAISHFGRRHYDGNQYSMPFGTGLNNVNSNTGTFGVTSAQVSQAFPCNTQDNVPFTQTAVPTCLHGPACNSGGTTVFNVPSNQNVSSAAFLQGHSRSSAIPTVPGNIQGFTPTGAGHFPATVMSVLEPIEMADEPLTESEVDREFLTANFSPSPTKQQSLDVLQLAALKCGINRQSVHSDESQEMTREEGLLEPMCVAYKLPDEHSNKRKTRSINRLPKQSEVKVKVRQKTNDYMGTFMNAPKKIETTKDFDKVKTRFSMRGKERSSVLEEETCQCSLGDQMDIASEKIYRRKGKCFAMMAANIMLVGKYLFYAFEYNSQLYIPVVLLEMNLPVVKKRTFVAELKKAKYSVYTKTATQPEIDFVYDKCELLCKTLINVKGARKLFMALSQKCTSAFIKCICYEPVKVKLLGENSRCGFCGLSIMKPIPSVDTEPTGELLKLVISSGPEQKQNSEKTNKNQAVSEAENSFQLIDYDEDKWTLFKPLWGGEKNSVSVGQLSLLDMKINSYRFNNRMYVNVSELMLKRIIDQRVRKGQIGKTGAQMHSKFVYAPKGVEHKLMENNSLLFSGSQWVTIAALHYFLSFLSGKESNQLPKQGEKYRNLIMNGDYEYTEICKIKYSPEHFDEASEEPSDFDLEVQCPEESALTAAGEKASADLMPIHTKIVSLTANNVVHNWPDVSIEMAKENKMKGDGRKNHRSKKKMRTGKYVTTSIAKLRHRIKSGHLETEDNVTCHMTKSKTRRKNLKKNKENIAAEASDINNKPADVESEEAVETLVNMTQDSCIESSELPNISSIYLNEVNNSLDANHPHCSGKGGGEYVINVTDPAEALGQPEQYYTTDSIGNLTDVDGNLVKIPLQNEMGNYSGQSEIVLVYENGQFVQRSENVDCCSSDFSGIVNTLTDVVSTTGEIVPEVEHTEIITSEDGGVNNITLIKNNTRNSEHVPEVIRDSDCGNCEASIEVAGEVTRAEAIDLMQICVEAVGDMQACRDSQNKSWSSLNTPNLSMHSVNENMECVEEESNRNEFDLMISPNWLHSSSSRIRADGSFNDACIENSLAGGNTQNTCSDILNEQKFGSTDGSSLGFNYDEESQREKVVVEYMYKENILESANQSSDNTTTGFAQVHSIDGVTEELAHASNQTEEVSNMESELETEGNDSKRKEDADQVGTGTDSKLTDTILGDRSNIDELSLQPPAQVGTEYSQSENIPEYLDMPLLVTDSPANFRKRKSPRLVSRRLKQHGQITSKGITSAPNTKSKDQTSDSSCVYECAIKVSDLSEAPQDVVKPVIDTTKSSDNCIGDERNSVEKPGNTDRDAKTSPVPGSNTNTVLPKSNLPSKVQETYCSTSPLNNEVDTDIVGLVSTADVDETTKLGVKHSTVAKSDISTAVSENQASSPQNQPTNQENIKSCPEKLPCPDNQPCIDKSQVAEVDQEIPKKSKGPKKSSICEVHHGADRQFKIPGMASDEHGHPITDKELKRKLMEENIKKYIAFTRYTTSSGQIAFRVKKFLDGAEKAFPALFFPHPNNELTRLRREKFMEGASQYVYQVYMKCRELVSETGDTESVLSVHTCTSTQGDLSSRMSSTASREHLVKKAITPLQQDSTLVKISVHSPTGQVNQRHPAPDLFPEDFEPMKHSVKNPLSSTCKGEQEKCDKTEQSSGLQRESKALVSQYAVLKVALNLKKPEAEMSIRNKDSTIVSENLCLSNKDEQTSSNKCGGSCDCCIDQNQPPKKSDLCPGKTLNQGISEEQVFIDIPHHTRSEGSSQDTCQTEDHVEGLKEHTSIDCSKGMVHHESSKGIKLGEQTEAPKTFNVGSKHKTKGSIEQKGKYEHLKYNQSLLESTSRHKRRLSTKGLEQQEGSNSLNKPTSMTSNQTSNETSKERTKNSKHRRISENSEKQSNKSGHRKSIETYEEQSRNSKLSEKGENSEEEPRRCDPQATIKGAKEPTSNSLHRASSETSNKHPPSNKTSKERTARSKHRTSNKKFEEQIGSNRLKTETSSACHQSSETCEATRSEHGTKSETIEDRTTHSEQGTDSETGSYRARHSKHGTKCVTVSDKATHSKHRTKRETVSDRATHSNMYGTKCETVADGATHSEHGTNSEIAEDVTTISKNEIIGESSHEPASGCIHQAMSKTSPQAAGHSPYKTSTETSDPRTSRSYLCTNGGLAGERTSSSKHKTTNEHSEERKTKSKHRKTRNGKFKEQTGLTEKCRSKESTKEKNSRTEQRRSNDIVIEQLSSVVPNKNISSEGSNETVRTDRSKEEIFGVRHRGSSIANSERRTRSNCQTGNQSLNQQVVRSKQRISHERLKEQGNSENLKLRKGMDEFEDLASYKKSKIGTRKSNFIDLSSDILEDQTSSSNNSIRNANFKEKINSKSVNERKRKDVSKNVKNGKRSRRNTRSVKNEGCYDISTEQSYSVGCKVPLSIARSKYRTRNLCSTKPKVDANSNQECANERQKQLTINDSFKETSNSDSLKVPLSNGLTEEQTNCEGMGPVTCIAISNMRTGSNTTLGTSTNVPSHHGTYVDSSNEATKCHSPSEKRNSDKTDHHTDTEGTDTETTNKQSSRLWSMYQTKCKQLLESGSGYSLNDVNSSNEHVNGDNGKVGERCSVLKKQTRSLRKWEPISGGNTRPQACRERSSIDTEVIVVTDIESTKERTSSDGLKDTKNCVDSNKQYNIKPSKQRKTTDRSKMDNSLGCDRPVRLKRLRLKTSHEPNNCDISFDEQNIDPTHVSQKKADSSKSENSTNRTVKEKHIEDCPDEESLDCFIVEKPVDNCVHSKVIGCACSQTGVVRHDLNKISRKVNPRPRGRKALSKLGTAKTCRDGKKKEKGKTNKERPGNLNTDLNSHQESGIPIVESPGPHACSVDDTGIVEITSDMVTSLDDKDKKQRMQQTSPSTRSSDGKKERINTLTAAHDLVPRKVGQPQSTQGKENNLFTRKNVETITDSTIDADSTVNEQNRKRKLNANISDKYSKRKQQKRETESFDESGIKKVVISNCMAIGSSIHKQNASILSKSGKQADGRQKRGRIKMTFKKVNSNQPSEQTKPGIKMKLKKVDSNLKQVQDGNSVEKDELTYEKLKTLLIRKHHSLALRSDKSLETSSTQRQSLSSDVLTVESSKLANNDNTSDSEATVMHTGHSNWTCLEKQDSDVLVANGSNSKHKVSGIVEGDCYQMPQQDLMRVVREMTQCQVVLEKLQLNKDKTSQM